MNKYAIFIVDGVLRATASESPADPDDAPGEMWRDYRIFDEYGEYHSQHNGCRFTFDELVEHLTKNYTGETLHVAKIP